MRFDPDKFMDENDSTRICLIIRAKKYGGDDWKKWYKKFYPWLSKKGKEFLDSELSRKRTKFRY